MPNLPTALLSHAGRGAEDMCDSRGELWDSRGRRPVIVRLILHYAAAAAGSRQDAGTELARVRQ